jgi:hypothetical protein
MSTAPTLGPLQYFLIPAGAILGILIGMWLPKAEFVQRRASWVFWLAMIFNFLMLNLSYLAGGGVWARIIFAFTMGFLAFGVKLLR